MQKINSCESAKYLTFPFQTVLCALTTGCGTTGVPLALCCSRVSNSINIQLYSPFLVEKRNKMKRKKGKQTNHKVMTKNLVINSLSSGPLGDTAQEKGSKCMIINVLQGAQIKVCVDLRRHIISLFLGRLYCFYLFNYGIGLTPNR